MTLKACFRCLLATGLAFFMAQSAWAVDSVSLEIGDGDYTQLVRVGLQSQWQKRWWQSNGTHVGGYWDLTFSQWRWSASPGATQSYQHLTEVGITPVWRFQSDTQKGFYSEIGIGAHWLSEYYDNNGDRFSTRFQFGDHIGVGYVLQNGMDISLKIQHFSNAGIDQPNPGVLFGVLKVGYAF